MKPLSLVMVAACLRLIAADQAQFGEAWTRNMASRERGLPESFDPATGRNIRWTIALGTETHATPVIAEGRILVGTNNGQPRDPRHQGDRGVLMCFDARDGRFQWQLIVPKRVEDRFFDWPESGISSTATVEAGRAYLVDNRGVVLCLDLAGMANGNDGPFREEAIYAAPQASPEEGRAVPAAFTAHGRLRNEDIPCNRIEPGPLDADILWMFDLTLGAGIWSHDAAHSSILIHQDHLYLNTGTGVDNTHRRILRPDAPSLVVLDKRTGRYLARENEGIAPNIFHSTWAPPSRGSVGGQDLIFFAGGNGIVYAFRPLAARSASPGDADPIPVESLRREWQFVFDESAPRSDVHNFHQNKREGPSNFYGAPVFDKDRLYLAGGGDLWWGKNDAWLKCLNLSAAGPALRWSCPLVRHTFSTAAVARGLVYVSDCSQNLHCIDADTGRTLWTQALEGETWASPLVADGKVYIGTRRGWFHILADGRDKRVLSTIQLRAPVSATAVASDGVLYVATMTELLAIADPK